VATCGDCKYFIESLTKPTVMECHCKAPVAPVPNGGRWGTVTADEWCGEWAAVGAGIVNQYVNGIADLQGTSVNPLAPADLGVFDILVLQGCQVVNTSTKENCIVTFLDGPNPNKPIGYVSAPAHDSRDFRFNPGLRASAGNSICAKLDQDVTPDHVYVTAQGFALRSS